MKVKKFISADEVISDGTLITLVDKPFSFQIEDLEFTFQFKKDSTKPIAMYEGMQEGDDKKKLTILLYNFNSTVEGTRDPIEIGYIGERKLFLNFRVNSLTDDAGKSFHYTWFLRK